MPAAISDSALELVARYFDAATVRRALDDGPRVHLVKPGWPVVGRLRAEGDDDGQVVTVHLVAGGVQLRCECSCGVADCRHAAATALVAFARDGAEAAARIDASRQEVVGAWLAELGRGEAAPPRAAATDRVVVYLLDARGGVLGLTALQCARLSGGLGGAQALGAHGDPQRGAPPWVPVDDLRRIALLRAVTRVPPQVTRLPIERVPGELLRELAEAGRLHWGSVKTAPLRWGPTIDDALRWLPTDDGDALRIGVASERVLVAAASCHYVDPGAGAIGPLELGVDPAVVQRLLAGPPVPASMRATVERSLAPLVGRLGRAPGAGGGPVDDEAPVDVARDAAAPTAPTLRPRMVASLTDEGGGRRAVHVAGEALYGDDRFDLGVWDAARPLPRDLVAEGRLQARLDELLAALPHGGKAARSLDVLADARHVAQSIVPALRREGWTCALSDDFPHEAPLEDVAWTEALRPLEGGRDWFALELGVTVAGRTVPLLPILLDAIRSGQLLVDATGGAIDGGAGLNLRLPDGELVHVPADRVRRWLRPLIELALSGRLDDDGALRLPGFVATTLEVGAPGRLDDLAELAAARERLAGLLDLAPATERPGFGGTLRGYQRRGLAWLHLLHRAGYGGVLADEMGLGKTVQLLAFLDDLAADGRLPARAPALVVAPRSVVGNWAREAERFAPGLAPRVHLGQGRAEAPAELAGAPLILTSYQTLARDLELFRAIEWTTVILDEAQALKNPDTRLRAAAAALRATSRFCVTGTPLENHLGELWSAVDLAAPGLLGKKRAFETVFRRPIEKHGATAPLDHLRQRVRPFLLRRTKDEVALDLPPKTEIVERIELDVDQRDLYESLRLKLDAKVQRALADRGVQATVVVLDALLKLRQCCCDPRLVKLAEARRVAGSAKLERLVAMLEELADSGRAALVFSQFTSMLHLIEQACAAAGVATLSLTGETRDRDGVVRRFQGGEASALLVSLKTGGVGLNLTRADTVIHYDPWWNPAVEAQATDRAHRIGQDRPVLVYKLVARGTVEEAIGALQDDKRRLAAAALAGGGATRLAADDLAALLRPPP